MRIFLLIACGALLSCDKHTPADPAFFIQPAQIKVTPQPGQGTSSHRITDLWLYVDNQFTGCYPIGGKLPVPAHDRPVLVQVYAGIRNNGITTTRFRWPFYDFVRIDTLAKSGTTVDRSFSFKYASAVTFTWVENCDGDPGLSVDKASISDAEVEHLPPSESYEGRSVAMTLSPGDLTAKMESREMYGLPRYNSNVFLELNYKCTAELIVGVSDDTNVERAALVLNPQPEWNKIYIQLAEAVSREPASLKFRVFFRMNNVDNGHHRFSLDNMKLLYI